jgi:hypothetical protein
MTHIPKTASSCSPTNLWRLSVYIAFIVGLWLSALYVHYAAHRNVSGFVRSPYKSLSKPTIVSSQDRCTELLAFYCSYRSPECASNSLYYQPSFNIRRLGCSLRTIRSSSGGCLGNNQDCWSSSELLQESKKSLKIYGGMICEIFDM